MRQLIAGLGVLAILTACSGGDDKAGTKTGETANAEAAPAGRFYDREAFTIRYRLEGVQTGTRTEYVRDWGRLRATEEDTTMTIMGQTQPVRQRQVFEGPTTYSVDLTTNAVTVVENPIYRELMADMQGQSPIAYGKALMRRMGGVETAETGRFAGHDCRYWTIMGTRTCVADWGGTLHVETRAAGFSIVQTATEVRMGDGGPDGAFQVDKAAAQRVEVPDMTMEDVEAATKAGEEAMRRLQQIAPGG